MFRCLLILKKNIKILRNKRINQLNNLVIFFRFALSARAIFSCAFKIFGLRCFKLTRKIHKVLVANRGEIAIRVFRACNELHIRTVAIYSREDSASYHRYKADEAYIVGEGKKPIDAYLDIEGIIEIAKERAVDAIHPGYGFLSENIDFARRCEEEGIIFIGPKSKHLDMFGDKVKARKQAEIAQIPVIPGSDGPIKNWQEAKTFGEQVGFPVMIKASLGGGGRGMRAVN